jgi:rhodanese-related sulfurtransferase
MSSATIVDLPRISNDKLAELIKAKDKTITVVDVRDSDYIGGHILGGQNVPTSTHDTSMPELVRTLKDQETVVFHCALSQQRGPASALKYIREKERMGLKGDSGKEQKVVVLDGGFTKWQEKYVVIY